MYNGHCSVDDHDVDDDYFRSLLISFWADINKQNFLVSTDKRDMYALWRMMAFLEEKYMDQIRGVDKMGDSAGWDVYNNPIDGENVAPTNQDWEDAKQDPYMLPHAMVEADAIMNVFKQSEHSKLMSPGMQVDFYRRYINICRDHIDTVCRRVLRDLDEEFEMEKQLYLNDADAMNEIQSIRSTYVKEIQQTFSKAMRYMAVLSRCH